MKPLLRLRILPPLPPLLLSLLVLLPMLSATSATSAACVFFDHRPNRRGERPLANKVRRRDRCGGRCGCPQILRAHARARSPRALADAPLAALASQALSRRSPRPWRLLTGHGGRPPRTLLNRSR